MSTPTATSSPTPAASAGSNNPNNGPPSIGNSASLYLYTFLATLVLLLGVSAAIVIRSLVLRRRHRRMIEEAIRNGTYVSPSVLAHSRGRVDLAKKPKLWEATVLRELNSKGEWSDVFPVSASISSKTGTIPLPVTTSNSSSDTSSDSTTDNAVSTTTTTSRLRAIPRGALGAWRFISPTSRRSASPSSTSNSSSSAETKPRQPHQALPSAETTTPTHFDVAVLIAMPGAANRAKEGGEDEDLPHVEVGVAEIVVPPGTPLIQGVQEGPSGAEQV
ncbi:hypothetical protein BDP27DRAFT_1364518 [Rhodocollybia butyracea]|uniref:Uncharacterized protein n=1 Tax=Rhodocollybia butyracea TaxID=206335 RepID=A0A9P5PTU4_9AGAR|nr:hypothetical protein BDP27DRAFT_1364518 [Rhodocollybia butyracea]